MFAPVLRAFGRPPMTLFTNGRKVNELGLSDDELTALQANQCQWEESTIARLTPTHVQSTTAQPDPPTAVLPPSVDGLKVELTNGSSVDIGMMYIRPPFLHSPLVTQLGLKLKEPFMSVDVDMFCKSTSHPTVYVGGDAMTPLASVVNAMANGGTAAAGCNHDLAAEDWSTTLKEAGIEVKASAAGHDFIKEVGKMMGVKDSKDEAAAAKAVNAD